MKRFIQLHLLTSYPPANLNRDDLGRPKTAMMGGKVRLRVSSQSLKRAWRTSTVFAQALKGHVGIRTREIGKYIIDCLTEKDVEKTKAEDLLKSIIERFSKLEADDKNEKGKKGKLYDPVGQLIYFSPEERNDICDEIKELLEVKVPSEKDKKVKEKQRKILLEKLCKKEHKAADISLFGRMLADSPKHNTEAAAQVAHAISVHAVEVEDDYFTAVDDLNKGEEDAGAGHLGQTEFGAGVFYLYLCIDRESLVENLSGDCALADKTLAALIECAATVAPTGKQNSFASRARASYVRCEIGDQQPRSLSVAFLKPVKGDNMLDAAIKCLEDEAARQDKAYGNCVDAKCVMNVVAGKGTLKEVVNFATGTDHA